MPQLVKSPHLIPTFFTKSVQVLKILIAPKIVKNRFKWTQNKNSPKIVLLGSPNAFVYMRTVHAMRA